MLIDLGICTAGAAVAMCGHLRCTRRWLLHLAPLAVMVVVGRGLWGMLPSWCCIGVLMALCAVCVAWSNSRGEQVEIVADSLATGMVLALLLIRQQTQTMPMAMTGMEHPGTAPSAGVCVVLTVGVALWVWCRYEARPLRQDRSSADGLIETSASGPLSTAGSAIMLAGMALMLL